LQVHQPVSVDGMDYPKKNINLNLTQLKHKLNNPSITHKPKQPIAVGATVDQTATPTGLADRRLSTMGTFGSQTVTSTETERPTESLLHDLTYGWIIHPSI
jgi:hypothetical protein